MFACLGNSPAGASLIEGFRGPSPLSLALEWLGMTGRSPRVGRRGSLRNAFGAVRQSVRVVRNSFEPCDGPFEPREIR